MFLNKEQLDKYLISDVDILDVRRDIKEEPKYQIGEIVDLETWGGFKENFKVEDIKITWHPRMCRYCWGYKLSGNERTGFNFIYIPEGYLRKRG